MGIWELPTVRTEWDLSSSDIRSWEETSNFVLEDLGGKLRMDG